MKNDTVRERVRGKRRYRCSMLRTSRLQTETGLTSSSQNIVSGIHRRQNHGWNLQAVRSLSFQPGPSLAPEDIVLDRTSFRVRHIVYYPEPISLTLQTRSWSCKCELFHTCFGIPVWICLGRPWRLVQAHYCAICRANCHQVACWELLHRLFHATRTEI